MSRDAILVVAVLALGCASLAYAQSQGAPQSQPAPQSAVPAEQPVPVAEKAKGPISIEPTKPAKPAMPRIVPYVDYSGDLWHRPALTGDWGGLRQKLMDKGIRFNLNITQTYQGNVAGGTIQRGYYQGGVRYELALDTGYMGLWPGGMLMVRGETQYGNSDNFHTGSLMPVNSDALYPVPSGDQTALTELYYMQFVAPQLGFLAGRMSLRLNTPFTGDETTQFMNTALFVPPILGTTFPLVTTAAGAIMLPTKWLTISTLVLDSEGKGTLSGFDPDTVFTGGTSIFQQVQATIKPFGLTGHQGLIWTWSDRQRVAFEQSAFAIISNVRQGIPPVLARSSDDWTVIYSFDQYLYNPPGKPDEGIGIFGYYGVGPGVVNPIRANYCIGVGGQGMIPTRSKDTYGIGYYFINLSDKLPQSIRTRVEDEQGVELFYNIAVTPWLHVTPDLQIIDPARKSVDTDWVLGLRVRMDL
jgi:porin